MALEYYQVMRVAPFNKFKYASNHTGYRAYVTIINDKKCEVSLCESDIAAT